ncbi:TldD/PmbA family protein [Prochlorothrix hollandica]|uniref:Peptidase C69 n=1 Tax=Prochlorothrix hollandica PCC 9006 = CALU 1027 TaxID=317619 RepID=A0A0M2PXN7_PROHO|nr:TldD/PmbA family protein [Prochlorothrix hollandica]KKI99433.1 peptidase C69 [Prochlorothrix hollandica PCC 9006 = CALU 1027]
MAIQIDTLRNQVQDIAQKLGIHKYDISGSSVDETSVQVDRGEPKQVKASQRSGVTVRVWNSDGTLGITSTSDVDQAGVELALKTAYEASFFGRKEYIPDFSPQAMDPIATVLEPTVEPAAVSTLIERLIDAEKDLLSRHTAIASVPYNGLSQRDVERFYLNSAGAARADGGFYTSLYLYTKTEQEGRKPRSAGAYRVSHSLGDLDIAGCIAETAEKTLSHLDYHKVDTGKYTVVFSPEAFLDLLGAFSNLYNAQSILDNRSLSKAESLGTAIASPLLSVYDDALHTANIGASAFDGEGTPTRRISLIEQGVLSHFLHSEGTARRMGAQPTGHANLGAKVSVGPHFYHAFAANPGDQSLSLDKADNVVWIDDLQALHAGVQSLEGSFSLPFDGWLMKGGEAVSIESATVAGDFLQLLKAIVLVEAEEKLTPGGVAPKVWVEGLSITGE